MQQAVCCCLPRIRSPAAGGLVGDLHQELVEFPLKHVRTVVAFPYFLGNAVEQSWPLYEETVVVLGLNAPHCSSAKRRDLTVAAVPSSRRSDSVCPFHIWDNALDDLPHVYDDVPFPSVLD